MSAPRSKKRPLKKKSSKTVVKAAPKATARVATKTAVKTRVKSLGSKRPVSKNAAVPMMSKRLEVTYKGRVQGVGFRFCAEKIALECGVTGWVRNEHNGDVTLVAEASEKKLLLLLAGIRQCPVGRHIAKEQIYWDACRNEFDDFRIEYHC